jgi:trans-2,3-dihydro-3-hydroxyanthranilate isomerase
MPAYAYRLLNVFAEETLGGNPLCVFEDGRGLDAATMQALALQFNLSETTFILPSDRATARVRIFTPTFEMPFAGHPTLGTAHVVRDLQRTGDRLTLEEIAGIIPLEARGSRWTLTANAPKVRPVEATVTDFARWLGLEPGDIGEPRLWVDTGSEQLVVPLRSVEAVERCAPSSALLGEWPQNSREAGMIYVWARSSERAGTVRFFFEKYGAIVEDPATGSACANLGGWFVARSQPLPVALRLSQGTQVGRPCVLDLAVDAAGSIRVTGNVIPLGRGVIELA